MNRWPCMKNHICTAKMLRRYALCCIPLRLKKGIKTGGLTVPKVCCNSSPTFSRMPWKLMRSRVDSWKNHELIRSISKSLSAKELVCRRNKPELWQVKKRIYLGKQVKWVYIVRVDFWMLSFLLWHVLLSERGWGAQGNKNELVPLQRCRRPIWWNSNSSLFRVYKELVQES